MRCPSCGHKNPAGLSRCNFCSATLPTKKKKEREALRKKRLRMGIIGVVAALLLPCLIFFTKIETSVAVRLIHTEHYALPASLWQSSTNQSLHDLGTYAALRDTLNSTYPDLSAHFDRDTLTDWFQTAENLQSGDHIKDPAIRKELDSLTTDLQYVLQADATYTTLRGTTLDIMDVFAEYNRLHLSGEGGNIGFTPQEELNQLTLWQADLNRLNQFAVTVKGYESVYLFSYMLKEAQGEINQLNSEINTILEKGYLPTDTVRYGDNTARTFPSVHNQGSVQLNVAQKENYEAHMQEDLRNFLITSTLIAYYS